MCLNLKQSSYIQSLGISNKQRFSEILDLIPSHNNPIHIEQAICVFVEELVRADKYILNFAEYIEAVGIDFAFLGRSSLPDIHPDLYHWYIIDSNKKYDCNIILHKDKHLEEWSYYCSEKPTNGFWYENKATIELEKLRQLGELSSIGQNISWNIIYDNERNF